MQDWGKSNKIWVQKRSAFSYLTILVLSVILFYCDDNSTQDRQIKSLSIITTIYNPDSNSTDSSKQYYQYDEQREEPVAYTFRSGIGGELYTVTSEDYQYNLSGDLLEFKQYNGKGSLVRKSNYTYSGDNSVDIKSWDNQGQLITREYELFDNDQLIVSHLSNILNQTETIIYNRYDDQGRKVYSGIFEHPPDQEFPKCIGMYRGKFNQQGQVIYEEQFGARSGSAKFHFKYDSTLDGILKWKKTIPGKDWLTKNPDFDNIWIYDSFTKSFRGKIKRRVAFENESFKFGDELHTFSSQDIRYMGMLYGLPVDSVWVYDPFLDERSYITYKHNALKNKPDTLTIIYEPSHITSYHYVTGYTKIDSFIRDGRKIETTTYDKSGNILLIESREYFFDPTKLNENGWPVWNKIETKIEYTLDPMKLPVWIKIETKTEYTYEFY